MCDGVNHMARVLFTQIRLTLSCPKSDLDSSNFLGLFAITIFMFKPQVDAIFGLKKLLLNHWQPQTRQTSYLRFRLSDQHPQGLNFFFLLLLAELSIMKFFKI